MERKMKNTHIPWLGLIPGDWGVSCVKKVLKFYTGWTPPTGKQELFEGDNLWANISDIGEKILYDAKGRVSDKAVQDSNIKISKKGSLLFSFKLSIGQVSFCGADMYTNEAIATFAPSMLCNLNYLYYMAPICIVENTGVNIYGAKLMNQDLIANATIPLPPLDEQEAIARFLDEKCAAVDELVKNTKEAIDRLKEMKKSIITEAVTKGLDKTAKLKQTQIPWLGEIPDGWVVSCVKKLFKIINGSTPKSDQKEYWDGDIYWITPAEMSNKICYINDSRRKITIEGLNSCGTSLVPLESVIISNRAPIGQVCLAGVELCTNQGCKSLVKKQELNSKYYYYFFLTQDDTLNVFGNGTTFLELSTESLANLTIPLPPLDEQEAIAGFLDEKCGKIDEVIKIKEEIIAKALEFKKSLIYECVTGKKEIN